MTEHVVTAEITDGEVTARSVVPGDRQPDYHVSNLRKGKWECSCGKSGMSDKEAADHLREASK